MRTPSARLVWTMLLLLAGSRADAADPSVSLSHGLRRALGKLAPAPRPCSSESVGKPWRGSLRCGGFLLAYGRLAPRSPLSYGTSQTLAALRTASDTLDAADPGGPAIEVFDLSPPAGGRSAYHLSHQSGRDVDLGYLYAEDPETLERFDAHRSWLLIEALIRTGEVQRIFVDYDLQESLYLEAAATQSRWLGVLFQYPRGPGSPRGLIRHWPNHRSHLHVRFRCPAGSSACRG